MSSLSSADNRSDGESKSETSFRQQELHIFNEGLDKIRQICISSHLISQESKDNAASEIELISRLSNIHLGDHLRLFPGPFNPFFEAIKNGNTPVVKLFISKGADINEKDSSGRTPLMLAITSQNNDSRFISELIEMGAKIDQVSDGRTPLLAAFLNMKRETATLLIKLGADVNNTTLPCFCFVEAVFSLHSNLVMMASGHRLQLTSFFELVALSTEIVMAGLHPRNLYITANRCLFDGFSKAELHALWKFQYLCLCLDFKVDSNSLLCAIEEIKDNIENESDKLQVSWMRERLDKLMWMKKYQSTPQSLTNICRVAIRAHLVDLNRHSDSPTHLSEKIHTLDLPKSCINFLLVKLDVRNITEYMKVD